MSTISHTPGHQFVGVWDLGKEQTEIPAPKPCYFDRSVLTPWFLSRGNLSSSCSKLEILVICISEGDKFSLGAIFRGLIDAPSILFIGDRKPGEEFLSRLAKCREGFNVISKDDIFSRSLYIIQKIGAVPEKKTKVRRDETNDIMRKKMEDSVREMESTAEGEIKNVIGEDGIPSTEMKPSVEKRIILSDKPSQIVDQSNMVLKVGQEMDELKQIFKSLQEGQEKGNAMISQISSRMDSSDTEMRKISIVVTAGEEEMRKISIRIDEEKEERKKDSEEITGLRDLLVEG